MRKEQIITANNNQMEEKSMKSRFIQNARGFQPLVCLSVSLVVVEG